MLPGRGVGQRESLHDESPINSARAAMTWKTSRAPGVVVHRVQGPNPVPRRRGPATLTTSQRYVTPSQAAVAALPVYRNPGKPPTPATAGVPLRSVMHRTASGQEGINVPSFGARDAQVLGNPWHSLGPARPGVVVAGIPQQPRRQHAGAPRFFSMREPADQVGTYVVTSKDVRGLLLTWTNVGS